MNPAALRTACAADVVKTSSKSGGRVIGTRAATIVSVKSLHPIAFATLAPAFALLTGCVMPPTAGVVRLYDGVLKAPDEAEAMAFCRIDGAPIRFLTEPRGDALPKDGVLFRCD